MAYRLQPATATSFGNPPPAVRAPALPSTGKAQGTVPAIMQKLWGFKLFAAVPPRFRQPGWSFEGFVQMPCHRCGTALAELRKPMTGGNRGKRYWALVCTTCPDVFAPDEIDPERWQHRKVRWKPSQSRSRS